MTEFFLVREIGLFPTNVVEKSRAQLSSVSFFSKNSASCEITWKNVGETDRPQLTMWYGPCPLDTG